VVVALMSQQFNTEMVNASAEVLLLQRCMYKVDKMNPLCFCHLLSSCKAREMAQHKGRLDKKLDHQSHVTGCKCISQPTGLLPNARLQLKAPSGLEKKGY
jgi:hypothetical protein